MAGDLRRLDTGPTHFLTPRNIGAPEGVWTESSEVAAFGHRGSLQGLTDTRVPQREAAAVRPDEDPLLRLRLVCRSFYTEAIHQVSQGEWSFTGLGLGIVDVTTPVPLRDEDDAGLKIYVAPLQAQEFGDSGAGGDCR